jgi:hypothetical protein
MPGKRSADEISYGTKKTLYETFFAGREFGSKIGVKARFDLF